MDDELDTIDIEKIRGVCNQQCRTQWTAIATRDRLYQFMAMSDENTQVDMRHDLSAMNDNEDLGASSSAGNTSVPRTTSKDYPSPGGGKR